MATRFERADESIKPVSTQAAASPPDGGSTGPICRNADSPPIRWREAVTVVSVVVLFDLLIFRGHGYSGVAVFLLAGCGMLLVGSPRRPHLAAATVLGTMACILAARLIWLGYGFLIVVGLMLLAAFAMAAIGRRPYVLDTIVHGLQSTAAGIPALARFRQLSHRTRQAVPNVAWLAVALPLVAVVGFGTIFVLANPDLATACGRGIRRFTETLKTSLSWLSLDAAEIVLWWVVAVVTAGLLRPFLIERILAPFAHGTWGEPDADEPLFETTLYAAYRNTLIAVIVLFAVYLVFEFKTLWFRDFPKGFYYAGYAHEGAAWLTTALAATVFVLSAIFRRPAMLDPRLPKLQQLAWGWSALNLMLALAVYHRMLIYIDFNGMTRMRTVGLFGITAVVVGFLLVVWKISKGRDFAWLIERQLWTLAVAVFLLAVAPVDVLVHTYNVRRILAGEPAPAVQITEHSVDSSGVLVLLPLTRSNDPLVRNGVRALLAGRAAELDETMKRRERVGWTSFQLADRLLHQRLQRERSEWQASLDAEARAAAWQEFKDYAYQWY